MGFSGGSSGSALGLNLPSGMILPCGIQLSKIPAGYLLCDGSAVSRAVYSDLFDAIGTLYGVGDGVTTFNLPDLRDKTTKGAPAATEGGATGGSNSVTLTTSEMPVHNHSVTNPTHTHQEGNATSGNAMNGPTNTMFVGGSPRGSNFQFGLATAQVSTTNNNGTGNAHENRQAFQEVQYLIKT